jgi:hypothetical protein
MNDAGGIFYCLVFLTGDSEEASQKCSLPDVPQHVEAMGDAFRFLGEGDEDEDESSGSPTTS